MNTAQRLPPSAICSLGWRPRLLTGAILDLLRVHFSDAMNLENDIFRRISLTGDPHNALQHYLWKPHSDDPGTPQTGIGVIPSDLWDPKSSDNRPALVVSRGKVTPRRIGIGDEMMGQPNIDMQRRFSNLKQGSHTVICIGGSGDEAENLAAEVARYLEGYQASIAQNFMLHRFVLAEIDTVHKMDRESVHQFGVPVSFAWAYEESWLLLQHSPVLAEITLSLESITE